MAAGSHVAGGPQILRIGVWELRHHADVPTSVILNEALELAKCYGDVDSPRFVNGILDPLAKELRVSEVS
jgi:N utilization substance protein B